MAVASAAEAGAEAAATTTAGEASFAIEAVALSSDHKPGEPEEKKRIEKAGGRVGLTAPGQPLRVFQRHGSMIYPGLAVSRSIGDQWTSHLGVISTPDVKEYELSEGDHDLFLILGSDGLWEWLTNQQAVNIVASCLSPDGASLDADAGAEKLVEEAQEVDRADQREVR